MMIFRGILCCLFLTAVVTSQVTMLHPEPYAGSAIPSINVTEGMELPASRRSLTQIVPGNCQITVRNLCPSTRYFLLAYQTVKGGKKGFFTEGWFNILSNKDAIVPKQITTQENITARQWFIRFGDGIKLNKAFTVAETARCIDAAKPFNTFSVFPGTARVACRYDGSYAGKCGACSELGGVAGHGFYALAPAYCTGTYTFEFSPANRNC